MSFSCSKNRLRIYLALFLTSFMAATGSSHAQRPEPLPVTLHLGDPTPALQVGEWMNGQPVRNFEKGRIYVIEFWATWCAPCKASIPRLSVLSKRYRRTVTAIGVNALEFDGNSRPKARAFVKSLGRKLKYRIASDSNRAMETNWYNAVGGGGIPKAYIIDQNGRLAWYGHPMYLKDVLSLIASKSWNIEKEKDKRHTDSLMEMLDDSLVVKVRQFAPNYLRGDNYGQPDSVLATIDKIVAGEPVLKHAVRINDEKFNALLRLNTADAYAFGKTLLDEAGTNERVFQYMMGTVGLEINEPFIKPEIYELGARAYQKYIDWFPYPELLNLHNSYSKMAEWYGKAESKLKAVKAHRMAIRALKKDKGN